MSDPARPASLSATKNNVPAAARWLATAGGLGLLPVAPGTWGSLAGLGLAWLFARGGGAGWIFPSGSVESFYIAHIPYPMIWWLALSAAGVWAASAVERASGKKDPQEVVIDEVSGQWLALLAGPALLSGALNWKSYLAGFILFRAFDIFKPFPARQAEALPGGWGIMADDWVAGAYAAGCLWLARGLGF